MDPTKMVNDNLLKVLGAMASMKQVVVTRDPVTGKYSISFQVASMSLTTGSYLQDVQVFSNNQSVNTGVKDGWIQLGDKWKYMKSGKYMKDEWIKYKNNWFYLGHDEFMVINWKEIKGHWYYFAPEDGHMKKGKKYIDGKWYYLRLTDQNGNEVDSNYMVTGWRKLDGKWYYFKKKEEDKTGRNQFGYMICESWREIDGEWYYFHEDGVMASDEWVGEYYVGANGAWNPEEELEDVFKYNWEKGGLPSSNFVTPEFLEKTVEIANKLDMDPDDLMAIMAYESWFDPTAENSVSSALGLIQFLESTAGELGTTTSALRKMTNVQQLDYVYKYLKKFKGKMNNLGDAYLAVFTGGKGMGESDSFILYKKGTKEYKANEVLDSSNKGYITRGDTLIAVRDRRSLFGLK